MFDKGHIHEVLEMFNSRTCHNLVNHGQQTLAIGGQDGSKVLRSVESFNHDSFEWEKIADMNCPRANLGSCSFASNNKNYVYIFGGQGADL